jgi:ATP-binding cassette subfamily F protein uup
MLSAKGLVKAFGPQMLLAGVDLAIDEDERVGLVGRNGAGKSTLARILAGQEAADGGEVAVRRGAEVLYLAQEPALPAEATARAVVLSGLEAWSRARARLEEAQAALGRGGVAEEEQRRLLAAHAQAMADLERLGGWDPDHRALALLDHLGVAHLADAPVGRLSGGERRRVALARILVARPALAILDEPTNHLDLATIEWLETDLAEEHRGALLLVTHDRYVLDRVCTRTLEIDGGRVYSYAGGYEDYLEAKAERLAQAERAEQNRQNLLRRELEWLRRTPAARTGKQKARIHRAQAAIAVQAPRAERTAALAAQVSRAGKTVLDARGLCVAVPGDPARVLVRGLDLALVAGERLGIVGPNGSGKTTLLRTLIGALPPAAGAVVRGKNTEIAYFDQGRTGLDDGASILDNITGGRPRVEVDGRVMDARAYGERFLFDPAKQRQLVGSLSGGERARVALARLLLQPANLLVLDEPTNDLDVPTLGALEEMLVEAGATALVVTHDRFFLDRVATGLLVLEPDATQPPADGAPRRAVRYAGGWGDYLAQRAAAAEAAAAAGRAAPGTEAPSVRAGPKESAAAAPGPAAADKRGKRPLTYAERLELEGLPAAIDAADARVRDLEARLAEPTTYSDGTDVPALVRALDAAREESARLLERWEALETKAAG